MYVLVKAFVTHT